MQTHEQKVLNLSSYEKYREVLIDSVGTRIALSIYENIGPNVIFIPGTMSHPIFYDDFLTALARKGFRVIGIHLISHGKSPREKKTYTLTDMIQNVQDTVSYCDQHFTGDIHVMGSSQGAILSMAVASNPRIKSIFTHNIFIPALKETIAITSFPDFMKHLQKGITFTMKIGAKVFPRLPLPISAYLDVDKIFSSNEIRNIFFNDPIGLSKYPIAFLSSLFSADMTSATNGSIKCPVIVITSKGDPLFPYPYIKQVYEIIVAPKKEMLVFDESCHLILNERVEQIIDPIADKLKQYSS